MERQSGNGIYALIGAAAVVVVAALVGFLVLEPAAGGATGQAVSPQVATAPAIGSDAAIQPGKDKSASATEKHPKPEKQAGSGDAPAMPPVQDNGKTDQVMPTPEAHPAGPAPTGKADAKAVYPSFDHVRIEPNGENVFAGRVAPGATVEMIRDGQVYARAVADTSGLFALSAPPLPVGASQIYLQSIAPDGTRQSSRESVTVMINQDKTKRPLVALTSPDKPSVVLSNPDSPDARRPEDKDTSPTGKPAGQPVMRAEVKIVSVEARDGGRLYVSGHAAPGASVKLYLNGVMVAPGGADSDGNLSFTIDRGMAAGAYAVRLDDVDPVSGQLKSKSEVTFTVPDLAALQAGSEPPAASSPAEGPAPATAPQSTAPSAMRKATVARGDSLWSISERYYGSGYLYLEVYDANMRKIKNPNTIYPGQVIELPPLEVPKDK